MGFGGRLPGDGDNWMPQPKNEQENPVPTFGTPILVLLLFGFLIVFVALANK